eukprot:15357538-Ditylum_brightwellii.AAC.1
MSINPMKIGQENSHSTVVSEGLHTRIFCFVDKNKEFGGCTGAVAMKILTEEFPEVEQISQLENEYGVTQHLSKLRFIRPALNFVKKE